MLRAARKKQHDVDRADPHALRPAPHAGGGGAAECTPEREEGTAARHDAAASGQGWDDRARGGSGGSDGGGGGRLPSTPEMATLYWDESVYVRWPYARAAGVGVQESA